MLKKQLLNQCVARKDLLYVPSLRGTLHNYYNFESQRLTSTTSLIVVVKKGCLRTLYVACGRLRKHCLFLYSIGRHRMFLMKKTCECLKSGFHYDINTSSHVTVERTPTTQVQNVGMHRMDNRPYFRQLALKQYGGLMLSL